MTQQIQHRMSNPSSPWVALGLLTVGGVIGYYYFVAENKKKKEEDVPKAEAQVIPPSAWTVDPNDPPVPNEVEAGQLYKAVFTLPLVGEGVPGNITYLPPEAFDVLDVLIQDIQDEAEATVGAQVTITFIPKLVAETAGDASILAGDDNVFRGLALSIQE